MTAWDFANLAAYDGGTNKTMPPVKALSEAIATDDDEFPSDYRAGLPDSRECGYDSHLYVATTVLRRFSRTVLGR